MWRSLMKDAPVTERVIAPAPESVAPVSKAADMSQPVDTDLELSPDDLEHVIGGLERPYVYEPGTMTAPPAP